MMYIIIITIHKLNKIKNKLFIIYKLNLGIILNLH